MTIKHRDEHGSRKGELFETELTIFRALDLKENEAIEIHRGEDIDIISYNESNIEVHRTLEQAKHKSKRITLRSKEVVISISNYLEHLSTGLWPNINFMLTTDAEVGKEKEESIKEKGIDVWRKIQSDKTLTSYQRSEYCDNIREILLTSNYPKMLKVKGEKAEKQFEDFLQKSSNEQFSEAVSYTHLTLPTN